MPTEPSAKSINLATSEGKVIYSQVVNRLDMDGAEGLNECCADGVVEYDECILFVVESSGFMVCLATRVKECVA